MQYLVKKQKNRFVFKLFVVLVCLGLLLAGSGWTLAPAAAITPAAAQATVTPDSEAGLANSQWRLVSFGAPGAETPVIEGSTVTLEFGAGSQAGGSGGCNSYGGEYQVQGGALSVSQIVSTLMACVDERVTQQEQQYFQALEAAGRFELAADQLTIWYDDGQGVLNFVRASATADDGSAGVQPTPEQADEAGMLTPREALQRLFTSETLDESWFAGPFLVQVPVSQVEAIRAQLSQQFGDFERIEGEASPFTVIFVEGQITAEMALDVEGRIIGLHFFAPTPLLGSLDEAIAAFQQLPGEVSVVVLKDGEEIAGLNADSSLAVASAFKLAVLAALQEQIEAGEHTWDEVVRLQPEWKSLPYSLLKDWPDGSPLTLHTLASLMISASDNTAADALVHILGREAVETFTPGNRPLLTTLEASKLKALENSGLRERYHNGSEAEKRQVIAALNDLPVPAVQNLSTEPTLDVAWHFTTRDLCRLLAQVEELDLMTIESGPGVANQEKWSRVAYKGGSELGALNLTTWLEGRNNASYCVSATLNNPDAPIDQETFFGLYRGLVETLP